MTCTKCGQAHERVGSGGFGTGTEPRPTCTAHHRGSGRPCLTFPAKGSTVCRMHGGHSPQAKAKAAERRKQEAVRAKVRRMVDERIDPDLEPIEALVSCLRQAVAWRDVLYEFATELERQPTSDERGHPFGLWGYDHLGDQAVNIVFTMYRQERDAVARYAKLALDAGIEERLVRLIAEDGRRIAAAVREIVADLQLTPEQWARFPGVARHHLLALSAGGPTADVIDLQPVGPDS